MSLLEVMVAVVILAGGVIAISSVSLVTVQGNHQASALGYMTDRTQALLESIKATTPTAISGTFDGAAIDVTNDAATDGTWLQNGVINVLVDDSVSRRLEITVSASWTVGSEPGALSFRTEIYNPDGM